MLAYADRIIALNKGVIVNDGTYQKILAETPEISAKSMISSNEQSLSSEDKISEVDNDGVEKNTTEVSINDPEEALIIKEQNLLRRNGSWDVYKYYVKSAGYKTTALFIFSVLITGFFSNFASEFDLFFCFVFLDIFANNTFQLSGFNGGQMRTRLSQMEGLRIILDSMQQYLCLTSWVSYAHASKWLFMFQVCRYTCSRQVTGCSSSI